MKALATIANGLDARMLRDVLALEGLHVKLAAASADARQGGAVTLLIEDDEFARGQALLARWMAEHPAPAPDSAPPASPPQSE
ncbi:hypothetical protein [Methyloversatilis discipulorum]|jgi:hypothetical protein|uniref:hypothetical protein n=1 Tax=Methyloversatilis discipulorum TaxID=1119528 RepID=UPI00037EE493|nr:hypothetical protein [Methyloversatilis discipulorum]